MPPEDAIVKSSEANSREDKALNRLERLHVHVLLPILVFVLIALTSASRKSATYDEPAILTSSIEYVRSLDPSLNAENPPLLKTLWGLPTTILPRVERPNPPPSLRYTYNLDALTGFARQFLFRHPHHRAILFAARPMNVLLAALLGVAVYVAALRIWNRAAALSALWIYALSPNIIAHARLVTPDLGCAALMFVTALSIPAAIRKNRWGLTVLSGLALGAALLTKFTALLLLPVMALQVALLMMRMRPRPGWRGVTLRLSTVLLIALFIINLPYGFAGFGTSLKTAGCRSSLLTAIRDIPILGRTPLPVPAGYVRGFDIAAFWNDAGVYNIFLGKLYPQGGSWWYYYVVVLFLKTPIPLLIGLFAGVVILARGNAADRDRLLLLGLMPLLLFLSFSFLSKRQLGLRYILPVWPFMVLVAGAAAERALRGGRMTRRCLVLLAGWYAASSLLSYPDYLPYFNVLAGGNRHGWRLLADSNADWGQDLPALAAWQEKHGYPPTYVATYGTAPPEAYDVRRTRWTDRPAPEYLAISTTSRYLAGGDPRIRSVIGDAGPIERLGDTIHIFKVRRGEGDALPAPGRPANESSDERP